MGHLSRRIGRFFPVGLMVAILISLLGYRYQSDGWPAVWDYFWLALTSAVAGWLFVTALGYLITKLWRLRRR